MRSLPAFRPRTCLALVLLGSTAGVAAAASEPPEPLAVVTSVRGEVTARVPPDSAARPVELFAWLVAGTEMEVAAGGSAVVALADGSRFELGPGARASLAPAGLSAGAGPVRELPAVPPLPHVPAAQPGQTSGLVAGAVRIRGARVEGLYPADGARALTEATALRFEPAAGASRYEVELFDRAGQSLLKRQTRDLEVSVPSGLLQPGATYVWTVRTLDRKGPAALGEAAFETLGAEPAARREALHQAVEALGDAASWALLAEVDRGLGLHSEARAALREALARAPQDEALHGALERFGAAAPASAAQGPVPRRAGGTARVE